MAQAKDSKWVQVVAKLIQKTQTNQLKWKPIALNFEGGKRRVTSSFAASYEDKLFRLYRSVEVRTAETPDSWRASLLFFGGGGPETKLEILDTEGKVIWTFPSTEMLNDLLTAVEYQAAGIDDFLDKILRE